MTKNTTNPRSTTMTITAATHTNRQILAEANRLREESFTDCARINRYLNSGGLSERLYREATDSALRLDSRFDLGGIVTTAPSAYALQRVLDLAKEVLA